MRKCSCLGELKITKIILSSLTWCLTLVSTFPLLISETVSDQAAQYVVSRCFFMTQWLKCLISCQLRTDIIQRPRPCGWKAPIFWHCKAWVLDSNIINLKTIHAIKSGLIINLNIIWLNSKALAVNTVKNSIKFILFSPSADGIKFPKYNDVILYGLCESGGLGLHHHERRRIFTAQNGFDWTIWVSAIRGNGRSYVMHTVFSFTFLLCCSEFFHYDFKEQCSSANQHGTYSLCGSLTVLQNKYTHTEVNEPRFDLWPPQAHLRAWRFDGGRRGVRCRKAGVNKNIRLNICSVCGRQRSFLSSKWTVVTVNSGVAKVEITSILF